MSTHVWHFGNTRAKDGTGLVTVVCNTCGEVRAAEARTEERTVLDMTGECEVPRVALDGGSYESIAVGAAAARHDGDGKPRTGRATRS